MQLGSGNSSPGANSNPVSIHPKVRGRGYLNMSINSVLRIWGSCINKLSRMKIELTTLESNGNRNSMMKNCTKMHIQKEQTTSHSKGLASISKIASMPKNCGIWIKNMKMHPFSILWLISFRKCIKE